MKILPGFVEIPTLQVSCSRDPSGAGWRYYCPALWKYPLLGRQQQGPNWGRLEILPGLVEIPTLQVGCNRDPSRAG